MHPHAVRHSLEDALPPRPLETLSPVTPRIERYCSLVELTVFNFLILLLNLLGVKVETDEDLQARSCSSTFLLCSQGAAVLGRPGAHLSSGH